MSEGINQRPRHRKVQARRSAVVEFRVHCEEAASEETRQRQTKKEENTLEIALAAVAQDHHHPKKGQERPSGEKDKSKIERPAHRC